MFRSSSCPTTTTIPFHCSKFSNLYQNSNNLSHNA